MATIRNRNGRWHVQVRRQNTQPVSKTFSQRKDAEAWARMVERDIETGSFKPANRSWMHHTFSDLLTKYEREEGKYKKSYHVERHYLNRLRNADFAHLPAAQITAEQLQAWINQLRQTHKPSSIARQVGLISRVFNVAIKRWGYSIDNPTSFVTKPVVRAPHIPRIPVDTIKVLQNPTSQFSWLVVFALETGMRRAEIIGLRWRDYFPEKRLVQLINTKNGESRLVPLSSRAVEAIEHGAREDECIFPMTGNAVKLAWRRLKRQHKITGVRFHDLRHEAISRFFEDGLSVAEVALISGHKDLRMLMRYTHLRAEELAKKLG